MRTDKQIYSVSQSRINVVRVGCLTYPYCTYRTVLVQVQISSYEYMLVRVHVRKLQFPGTVHVLGTSMTFGTVCDGSAVFGFGSALFGIQPVRKATSISLSGLRTPATPDRQSWTEHENLCRTQQVGRLVGPSRNWSDGLEETREIFGNIRKHSEIFGTAADNLTRTETRAPWCAAQ